MPISLPRFFRPARSVDRGANPRRTGWVTLLLLPGLLFSGGNGNFSRADDAPTPKPATKPVRSNTASNKAADKAIERGITRLVGSIRRNGTVGIDPDLYSGPDLACTAMVGLTLLAEGSTPRGGQYADECRLLVGGVIDLVEARLQERGRVRMMTLIQRKIGPDADLFIAAHFLSEVYFESPGDEKIIHDTLEKLVRHICNAQRSDGTWGSESWAPVLGTVLGWRCLTSSRSTGFEVDASARLVGEALVKSLENLTSDRDNWMHNLYRDASSLRVLYSLGQKDSPLFQETLQRLQGVVQKDTRAFTQAGGEEYLAFSLVTECLLKEQRPEWSDWFPRVQSGLVQMQNADGTWSGHHCITDRTFCTAAALQTLLSPKRCLVTSDL